MKMEELLPLKVYPYTLNYKVIRETCCDIPISRTITIFFPRNFYDILKSDGMEIHVIKRFTNMFFIQLHVCKCGSKFDVNSSIGKGRQFHYRKIKVKDLTYASKSVTVDLQWLNQ